MKRYNLLEVKRRNSRVERKAVKELARLSFEIAMSKLNESQKSNFQQERVNPNLIKNFLE